MVTRLSANKYPKRKSIRLQGFDYSQGGAYFVTINCYKKLKLFGHQAGEEIVLNNLGRIAHAVWHQIPLHFPNIELDAFVVMPSHIHGIIFINEAGVRA